MSTRGNWLRVAARNGRELRVAVAVIFGVKENAQRIWRPVQIQGIAVIVATDLPHFSAGEWDHIKIRHRVRALRFRITGEGDGPAVGRNGWSTPGAGFGDEF